MALRHFLRDMTLLVQDEADPARQQGAAMELLRRLVGQGGWLAPDFSAAGPAFRQVLLYNDPLDRFSLVAFIWGSEARQTPVHDHGIWGVVGVLEGEEISTEMIPDPGGGPMRPGRQDRLQAGEVMLLGAPAYDIHKTANGQPGAPAITIHLYGGNIGSAERRVYDEATSAATVIRSGYDNPVLPNPWSLPVAIFA
ncbi:cysteine dioxygenase family protein [Plastoroseomonas arctica]|uniref:Cysteine dioxygenase n=1 Tax=Plastoroseomonas arctica TaxID=1509237 RepID=A0AAF1JV13_9PROT|nr:cysteine dioxygenase [Plastoroseomonas arctica]MBR0653717.1 cysteine dioxygenase [Plastoroseomonas arctica]